MTAALPLWLAAILPLAAHASNWLNRDRLPREVNAIIATALISVAVIAWAVTAHSLTPNLVDDILLVVAYIGVLAGNALRPLYEVVAGSSSDVSPWTPTNTPGTPRASLLSQANETWKETTQSQPAVSPPGQTEPGE